MSQGDGDYYLKLQIKFDASPQTRAIPEGDEDGDVREKAHYHENDINDLCFFIYNDGGNLFTNAADATPIKYSRYIGGLSLSSYPDNTFPVEYTSPTVLVKGYEPVEGDRIIVVANVGDISSAYTTVGALKTAKINKADVWMSAAKISDYCRFAMSSSLDDNGADKNGRMIISSAGVDGSYEHPFNATVTIERIAARVDWVLPKDSHGDPDLHAANGAHYVCREAGSEGDLYIKDIRIVNENQMPTYLIRRTATATSGGTPTYMGQQTVTNNLPNYYVIEPLTAAKTTSSISTDDADVITASPRKTRWDEVRNSWFGTSQFRNSKNNPSDFFGSAGTYSVNGNAEASKRFTEGSDICYTLGYVMENTMDMDLYGSIKYRNDVRTGVLLNAIFVPENVYTCASAGATPASTTYSRGTDFWYFEDRIDRTKSKFFKTVTDLDNYANGKSTDDYVKHHYVGNGDTTHGGGICYYYIWLKYAGYNNASEEGTYPMEYAIVRNNIYRIMVESIWTIGTETPKDEPTRERIFVRQWNKRVHPEILL